MASGYGRTQDFSSLASELERAAFHFGAMVSSAQALGISVSVFKNLEKQLVLTQAVAQGTTEEFMNMKEAVRDFALVSKFSAAEAANSLYFLASAGLSVTESLAAMPGVLALAQATLEPVQESADLVAATLSSFSLEADQAARVANLFTAAITQSQADMPKLAFSLRQVGTVAGVAGTSIEETTAALSVLYNVGLRGEQAGTALRNVMVRLAAPVGEAAEIMRSLGIQTINADGSMRQLESILTDIASKNLSESTLSRLFGTEALAGGVALLKSMGGEYQNLLGKITGTNEAFEVAAKQLDTLDGSLALAKNGVNELLISVGESLAPTIRELAEIVIDTANYWRDLDEGTKKTITTYGTLVVGILAVRKAFNLLRLGEEISLITRMVGGVGSLASVFITAGKNILNFGTAFNAAARWYNGSFVFMDGVMNMLAASTSRLSTVIFIFLQTLMKKGVIEAFSYALSGFTVIAGKARAAITALTAAMARNPLGILLVALAGLTAYFAGSKLIGMIDGFVKGITGAFDTENLDPVVTYADELEKQMKRIEKMFADKALQPKDREKALQGLGITAADNLDTAKKQYDENAKAIAELQKEQIVMENKLLDGSRGLGDKLFDSLFFSSDATGSAAFVQEYIDRTIAENASTREEIEEAKKWVAKNSALVEKFKKDVQEKGQAYGVAEFSKFIESRQDELPELLKQRLDNQEKMNKDIISIRQKQLDITSERGAALKQIVENIAKDPLSTLGIDLANMYKYDVSGKSKEQIRVLEANRKKQIEDLKKVASFNVTSDLVRDAMFGKMKSAEGYEKQYRDAFNKAYGNEVKTLEGEGKAANDRYIVVFSEALDKIVKERYKAQDKLNEQLAKKTPDFQKVISIGTERVLNQMGEDLKSSKTLFNKFIDDNRNSFGAIQGLTFAPSQTGLSRTYTISELLNGEYILQEATNKNGEIDQNLLNKLINSGSRERINQALSDAIKRGLPDNTQEEWQRLVTEANRDVSIIFDNVALGMSDAVEEGYARIAKAISIRNSTSLNMLDAELADANQYEYDYLTIFAAKKEKMYQEYQQKVQEIYRNINPDAVSAAGGLLAASEYADSQADLAKAEFEANIKSLDDELTVAAATIEGVYSKFYENIRQTQVDLNTKLFEMGKMTAGNFHVSDLRNGFVQYQQAAELERIEIEAKGKLNQLFIEYQNNIAKTRDASERERLNRAYEDGADAIIALSEAEKEYIKTDAWMFNQAQTNARNTIQLLEDTGRAHNSFWEGVSVATEKAVMDSQDDLYELGESFQKDFLDKTSTALADWATGVESSFSEALGNMARDVGYDLVKDSFNAMIRYMLQQMLGFQSTASGGSGFGIGNIVSSIGSFFMSAKGNVIPSGAKPMKFAKGGIPDLVNQPTNFTLPNGQPGQYGEAGWEGILPLRRNSKGQLGVMAQGGGSSNVITNNITVNVQGGGGDNPGALGDRISSAVSTALEKRMAAFLRTQQRPGGMLNEGITV
jgi:TP901 family phage tail tape measure protein